MLRELNLNEMMLVSGGQDNSGEGEGEPEEPPQPEQEHIEPESDTFDGTQRTATDGWGFEGDQGFLESGVDQWTNLPDTAARYGDMAIQAAIDFYNEGTQNGNVGEPSPQGF